MDEAGLDEPFDRMLADLFNSATVRQIERGALKPEIWNALESSGFLDAMVCESSGGANLSFAAVLPLLLALGRRAVPLPIGETIVARALLAQMGSDHRLGPIALGVQSLILPGAEHANFVLTEDSRGVKLQRLDGVETVSDKISESRDTLSRNEKPSGVEEDSATKIASAAAVLYAALIAGASEAVLKMCVDYALQRSQFGRPIARQQVLQQNLALASEHVVAARMACETAVRHGSWPSPLAAASAKLIASRAAPVVTRIAHGLHGAIGISGEHDLNLFTRLIHALRLAGGAENYWAGLIGREILADPRSTLDLVREEMFS